MYINECIYIQYEVGVITIQHKMNLVVCNNMKDLILKTKNKTITQLTLGSLISPHSIHLGNIVTILKV